MYERASREIAMVRAKYPSLQHGEKLDWALINNYPLPNDRYNKSNTKLLFLIPPGYPNTGPDCFFVEEDLQLKNGGKPLAFNPGANSTSGPAPITGNWGWFSWHPQSWRPASVIEEGDNLLTFLRGVSMCLRGEEVL